MIALTAEGMTIMCLFVVKVMIANNQTTNGHTQRGVNKQTNTIFSVTPSGEKMHQFAMGAHRKYFLVKKLNFFLWFVWTIILAVQFNVPLAPHTNQGILKQNAKLFF